MADSASLRVQLCTEQFGSRAPRGCHAAADGSLQWDGARRWGWLSGAPTANPGQDAGGGGGRWSALPVLSGLRAVLLPQGFPDSVSPDYLSYQLWDSVQVRLADCPGDLGGGGERWYSWGPREQANCSLHLHMEGWGARQSADSFPGHTAPVRAGRVQ